MSFKPEEPLLRAPFLQPEPGTGKPLTVLFSLLSRSDNTPLDQRSRGDGHTLDHHGRVIRDPAQDASANVLEPNPNLNFEHWGEYWRKVHGPRFVYTEASDDQSLTRLLRYDQLHRFAPGPTDGMAPAYRVPVDEHGQLWPTVVGHVPSYQRPQWDGVAYLGFAELQDLGIVFGNDRVRQKILPEDQALFRDIAPLLSRQYIVMPSQTGNDPVTLVKLHVRAQGSSREAFQHWWLHDHARLVKTHAGDWVKRYVQLHSTSPADPGEPFYHPKTRLMDGVTLMAFASVNDLEDFLRSDGYADIAEDEARMMNVHEGEWWTAIAIGLVNRIAPEQATAVCMP